ncbi:uncharacterized protein N7484_006898 [Penicillium longicatenatum]|uniref:uncharacterized protein n=1 Tax=Penicillium longicatenatum TaxID=1561947 RepID=UPI00254794BC|nr:uncharacterized protein N7484_006898 [Penicillium longicatenatum]KAJ5639036.1 hypothetical protein N7484_006898 [Penicillium longicatenatum]
MPPVSGAAPLLACFATRSNHGDSAFDRTPSSTIGHIRSVCVGTSLSHLPRVAFPAIIGFTCVMLALTKT